MPHAAALLCLCALAQDAAAPKEAECKELAAEYLALGAAEEGASRRGEILARLDAVPSLTAPQARAWAKRIAGLVGGEELVDRGGEHRLADGRTYYLGGKANRPAAILIHLHGGRTPDFATDPQALFYDGARRFDWAFIMPRRLDGEVWTDPGSERLVLDLLAAALRTWDVGSDRVFLSGTSAGAVGGWQLAARHADRLAGFAAFSGGPMPLVRDAGALDGVIPNVRNLPISMFHSADDQVTPVSATRDAVRNLGLARDRFGGGFPFHYLEIPGTKHGAPPDGTAQVYAKIADETRRPRPERVVWQPSSPLKRQMYWLRWEEPHQGALVDAELDREHNAVHVRAEGGAAGLEVLLDGELLDLERDVVVTLNGGEAFRGRLERKLPVLLRTGALGDERLAFEAAVRLDG